MSQPKTGGQPPPATPVTHGDKNASGASSTSGEEKAEVTEKSSGGANVSQLPKTQTSGAPSAAEQQPPTADASEPQLEKPSDTKAQSPSSSSMKTTSQPDSTEKAATAPTDQPPQIPCVETAKPESEKMSTVAGAGKASANVVAAAEASSAQRGMDELVLDNLIATLGGPEEDVPTSSVSTGPEVKEDIFSRYLEEMGKWEGSLPPEYVKLLKSEGDGKGGVPPKAEGQDEKTMSDFELEEALSSIFSCSTAPAEGMTSLTEKPSKEAEIMQAEVSSTVEASVPPKEKQTKSKEEIKDYALEALLDTLAGPEPEPEPEDLTLAVEVSEAKAKEKKEEKAGERDDTIPPEYRYTPELDKDGKPVLPKPEEKPQPFCESDLLDEFLKQFSYPAQPAAASKPSQPESTSEEPSAPVTAETTEDKVVPHTTTCTVQSSAPPAPVGDVADEALEALSHSLGKRKPDPEEEKPAVDKVMKKTKEEKVKKLDEDEETIPPDYSSTETRDKDGKVLLPKPEEESQAMSENDLIEGLTEGFSCSPSSSTPLPTGQKGKKATGSSDVLPDATVSSVHSGAPVPSTSGEKEMDKALDLLSDSLGQREPDPDEGKPIVDTVKEKATSEQREKLGERDETIPPEYLKLLELGEQSEQMNDMEPASSNQCRGDSALQLQLHQLSVVSAPENQGEPVQPAEKGDAKQKEQQKPTDDSAALDALSGDLGTCARPPATPQHSKEKSGKEAITPEGAQKDKGKPRDPETARGWSSSSKPEKQKAS